MAEELTLDGAKATTKEPATSVANAAEVKHESPVQRAEPRALHAVRDLRRTSAQEIEDLLNNGYELNEEIDTGSSKFAHFTKIND